MVSSANFLTRIELLHTAHETGLEIIFKTDRSSVANRALTNVTRQALQMKMHAMSVSTFPRRIPSEKARFKHNSTGGMPSIREDFPREPVSVGGTRSLIDPHPTGNSTMSNLMAERIEQDPYRVSIVLGLGEEALCPVSNVLVADSSDVSAAESRHVL